ncbi:MAG TPA: hypothetical protein VF157_06905, partial [Chloroflexota bacterium]
GLPACVGDQFVGAYGGRLPGSVDTIAVAWGVRIATQADWPPPRPTDAQIYEWAGNIGVPNCMGLDYVNEYSWLPGEDTGVDKRD